MKQINTVFISLSLIGLLTAETIVLQNRGDQKPCQDTYIEETINSSFFDKNIMETEVGTCVACHEKRIFIKFDLSTIPDADEIENAAIKIYCTADPISLSSTGEVYLPKKDWKEEQVNWFESATGEKWSSEGGDIALKPITSTVYDDVMKEKWASFDVTGTIQAMKRGDTPNRGFVILNDNTDHLYFESSESESEEFRPKLVIETSVTPIVLSKKYVAENVQFIQTNNFISLECVNNTVNALSLYSLNGQLLSKSTSSSLETIHFAKGSYILKGSLHSGTFTRLVSIGD